MSTLQELVERAKKTLAAEQTMFDELCMVQKNVQELLAVQARRVAVAGLAVADLEVALSKVVQDLTNP